MRLRNFRQRACISQAVRNDSDIELLEPRRLLSATINVLATGILGEAGSTLVADAAGNLYGVSPQGGPDRVGDVYEIAKGTHAVSVLATFGIGEHNLPTGALIADAAGDLYGTLSDASNGPGGPLDGTVYEITAGTRAFSTLAVFDGTNGSVPLSGVVADAAGNLYGTTGFGGTNDNGTVFEVAAKTHTLTTLYNFTGGSIDGGNPFSNLTFDAAGNLYGTTASGGSIGNGTLFKIDAASHAFTTLASYTAATGAGGDNGVIVDAAGNLFGTGFSGGANYAGVVYELPVGSHTITVLANFDKATTGDSPAGNLIADAAGNLYGVAEHGGTGGNDAFDDFGGTAYKVAAGTHALTAIADFDDQPTGTLIADAAGNLYGVALGGSGAIAGNVFELSNSGFVVASSANITATATATQTATAGTAKSFNLGSFTETGATGPYSVDIAWGDGTADTKYTATAPAPIASITHTFAKAGSDLGSITVTDSASHVSNKAAFDVTVSAAAPILSGVEYTIGSRTYSSLVGHTLNGETVSVTFMVNNPAGEYLSLVQYTTTTSKFSAATADQQKVFQSVSALYAAGVHTISITLPKTGFYQLDFVEGAVIAHFGAVGSNLFYAAQDRLISSDNE